MNIDRAIEIEKATAELFENLEKVFREYQETEHAEKCKAGAEEHRKIIEWLEKLKIMVTEVVE